MYTSKAKPIKKCISFILVLALSASAVAQSLDKSIDSLMVLQYKPGGTGAVALVSKGGKIIYNKAFGIANFELDVPMRTDMVFEIASITKQFTSVAILMLVEQGKLSLNDDIKKYLESYPGSEKITIQNLLNHTAGLNDLQMTEYITLNCGKRNFKPLEYIDRFKTQPSEAKPKEKWEYSNSGYFILGYIIEKVSGLKYDEFLKKNIFEPLEMSHSTCQVGNIRELVKNRAYGYDMDQNIYNAEYLYTFQSYAAGCILSTTEDLNKWNTALNSFKILKKESVEKLYLNYKLDNGEFTNYGLGFFLNNINGSTTYEHGGGAPGFSSNGIYLPKEDVYVVILSNCRGNDPEKVSLYIAGLTINKPIKRNEIKLDPEKLKEYIGVYKNETDSIFYDISFENLNLYFQKKTAKNIPAGRKYRILPSEIDNFFAADKFFEYQFVRNKKSEVTGIIVKTRRRMQIEKGNKMNG